jgi:hypothetical protein
VSISQRVRTQLGLPLKLPLYDWDHLGYQDLGVAPASWIQPANSLQQLYAWVSFTMPPSCHLPDGQATQPYLQYRVVIDGRESVSSVQNYGLGSTGTASLEIPAWLPEKSVDQQHTVTVGLTGATCARPGEEIELTDFGLDITTVR